MWIKVLSPAQVKSQVACWLLRSSAIQICIQKFKTGTYGTTMWRPRVDLSPILDIRAHGKARGARWRREHFRLPFKNQDRKLQKTTCRIWCTAHGKSWSTCTWETMRCMRAGDQREHLFPEILAPRVNTLHMENHCRKYFLLLLIQVRTNRIIHSNIPDVCNSFFSGRITYNVLNYAL